MTRNIVGPPARGEDFYDREEFVDLLWDRLETGNVLLAAPRRFGKTSAMYRLIDEPRPGWKTVHVDAESIREPVNFVIALLDALMADRQIRKWLLDSWKGVSSWARGLFEDLEVTTPWEVGLKLELKDAIGPHWQERGEALLSALRSCDQDLKFLLIIDELPVMLYLFRDNRVSDADTRAFLYWFRKLRTDPNVGLTNCRFLVGGSIGIERRLSELSAADSFNDFERVALGELPGTRAAQFLQELLESRGIAMSAATQRKILELVGTPIPYFIQIFVSELAVEKANGTERIGPKHVEAIYQHRVLGATCKTYFQHYYDRLRHYEKSEEQAAKALLKALALAQAGLLHAAQLKSTYRAAVGESATEGEFSSLLADLANDFYVTYVPEDDAYAFASKILRDWWRRYYAF